MSKMRQPVDTVLARGRKHLTEDEIRTRREAEVHPSQPVKQLRAPAWLPEELKPEFGQIAKQIIDLTPTLVARTDADTIAAFCMVRRQWVKATDILMAYMRESESVEISSKWAGVQSKLFAQARALAQDLGLTITSRCQLAVPNAGAKAPENPFEKLMAGGADE